MNEVELYQALGEHPKLIRFIHHNQNGIQRFEAPPF
jgi:serine/threonine-protein kinase SRK2